MADRLAHEGIRRGMGFDAAAKSAARRSGESVAAGRAMVAAGARKASAAAQRKNPNLLKVSGTKRKY